MTASLIAVYCQVSRRHFEIAFRMFDLDGNGNVEYEEVIRVTSQVSS